MPILNKILPTKQSITFIMVLFNGVIIGINKGTAEMIITKDNKKIVANVTVK